MRCRNTNTIILCEHCGASLNDPEKDVFIHENPPHTCKEMLIKELIRLRLDICEHATDTVWVGDAETAVDRISHILGDGDWYNEKYLVDNGFSK